MEALTTPVPSLSGARLTGTTGPTTIRTSFGTTVWAISRDGRFQIAKETRVYENLITVLVYAVDTNDVVAHILFDLDDDEAARRCANDIWRNGI